MVRRSSAAPGTWPCCPWWTLGGGALVAVATVTLSPGRVARGAGPAEALETTRPAAPAAPLLDDAHRAATPGVDRDEARDASNAEAGPGDGGYGESAAGARAGVGVGAE